MAQSTTKSGLHYYRVLHAMLAVEEFTLQEIAERSGVKITTVRSTKSRLEEYIIPSKGTAPSVPKRGGQTQWFRINSRGRKSLRAKLNRLFASLPGDNLASQPSESVISPSIHEMLIGQPSLYCDIKSREHLVKLAEAEAKMLGRSSNVSAAELRRFDNLLKFAKLELEIQRGRDISYWEVRQAFEYAASELAESDLLILRSRYDLCMEAIDLSVDKQANAIAAAIRESVPRDDWRIVILRVSGAVSARLGKMLLKIMGMNADVDPLALELNESRGIFRLVD
jgi:hypothetical protein